MPRRLTISLHPDGSITAEASGTPGPDCLDSLDQLRRILNAEIEGSKPTPEFSVSLPSVTITARDDDYLEDRA